MFSIAAVLEELKLQEIVNEVKKSGMRGGNKTGRQRTYSEPPVDLAIAESIRANLNGFEDWMLARSCGLSKWKRQCESKRQYRPFPSPHLCAVGHGPGAVNVLGNLQEALHVARGQVGDAAKQTAPARPFAVAGT